MSVLPGAEAFAADRGPIGVVVSHGFTGTPASMRPWAEYLADAGYSVRLPLLPGHGTRWQDMNHTGWPDWYESVEGAFEELTARCETVFACGLSMGGTLVTRLAQVKGGQVAGLVLVNPAYASERWDAKLAPLISWLIKSRPAIGSDIKKPDTSELAYDKTPVPAFVSLRKLWKVVLAELDQVRAPILLYRSLEDHVVEPLSAALLRRGATSTTVREVVLEQSYHVATLDNDAEQIFRGSVEFIESVLASRRGCAEHATTDASDGAPT